MPAEIKSRSRLTASGDGTQLVVSAEVKVNIPLIGGKIEKVVAEQVTKLLAAEAEYAEKWLAERTYSDVRSQLREAARQPDPRHHQPQPPAAM